MTPGKTPPILGFYWPDVLISVILLFIGLWAFCGGIVITLVLSSERVYRRASEPSTLNIVLIGCAGLCTFWSGYLLLSSKKMGALLLVGLVAALLGWVLYHKAWSKEFIVPILLVGYVILRLLGLLGPPLR